MNELKKHSLALALIAVLVLIKFVAVPVIEWQDGKFNELALKEKRVNKSALIFSEQETLIKQALKADEIKSNIERRLVAADNIEAFKLNQLKAIESLVNKHNLKLQNVGWREPIYLQSDTIVKYPVLLRVSGNTIDYVSFLSQVNQSETFMEVDNFNLNIRRQTAVQLGTFNGSMIINFYVVSKPS
jgi:hypothetical protein